MDEKRVGAYDNVDLLTVRDIAQIAQGAVPLTYATATPANVTIVVCGAPAEGRLRVVVSVEGRGNVSSDLSLYIKLADGSSHRVAADRWLTNYTWITLKRPLVLRAGETLSITDDAAVAADVAGAVGYMDVRA